MTGEEVAKQMGKLSDRVINLSAQKVKYAKHVDAEIDKIYARMHHIQSQCPHKDNGGMFHAVCEYCGLVD